jgi:hypothetical protein
MFVDCQTSHQLSPCDLVVSLVVLDHLEGPWPVEVEGKDLVDVGPQLRQR